MVCHLRRSYERIIRLSRYNSMDKTRMIRAITEAAEERGYKFPLGYHRQSEPELAIADIANEATIKLEIDDLCFDELRSQDTSVVEASIFWLKLRHRVVVVEDFGSDFENAERMADAFIDAVHEWERVQALLDKL